MIYIFRKIKNSVKKQTLFNNTNTMSNCFSLTDLILSVEATMFNKVNIYTSYFCTCLAWKFFIFSYTIYRFFSLNTLFQV